MDAIVQFFSKFPVWILLVLSSASVITGDFFAKYWSTKEKTLFLVIALLGYLFSGVFYIPVLKREGLVISSMIWVLLSTIGFIVIGVVLFKETLTPMQIAGIAAGTVALILLNL